MPGPIITIAGKSLSGITYSIQSNDIDDAIEQYAQLAYAIEEDSVETRVSEISKAAVETNASH